MLKGREDVETAVSTFQFGLCCQVVHGSELSVKPLFMAKRCFLQRHACVFGRDILLPEVAPSTNVVKLHKSRRLLLFIPVVLLRDSIHPKSRRPREPLLNP